MKCVDICCQIAVTSGVVKDLRFVIDGDGMMASQVADACRGAYFHPSRIARTRVSLTTSVCKCICNFPYRIRQYDALWHIMRSPATPGHGTAVGGSRLSASPTG